MAGGILWLPERIIESICASYSNPEVFSSDERGYNFHYLSGNLLNYMSPAIALLLASISRHDTKMTAVEIAVRST